MTTEHTPCTDVEEQSAETGDPHKSQTRSKWVRRCISAAIILTLIAGFGIRYTYEAEIICELRGGYHFFPEVPAPTFYFEEYAWGQVFGVHYSKIRLRYAGPNVYSLDDTDESFDYPPDDLFDDL